MIIIYWFNYNHNQIKNIGLEQEMMGGFNVSNFIDMNIFVMTFCALCVFLMFGVALLSAITWIIDILAHLYEKVWEIKIQKVHNKNNSKSKKN